MEAWIAALLSVTAVSLLSLAGVITLSLSQVKLKRILIYLVSFSAGAFLGDVFLHLLPEAVESTGFSMHLGLTALAGIVFSFVIEKFIHWRHCHEPTSEDHPHPFAIMNLVGDGVHNFIDGAIIAASYLVSIPVGIATTFAVALHEIPQELGDFGVLVHGGFSRTKALWFNFLSAATAILGAILVLLISRVADVVELLIPFAAGLFLYVAASDLVPEMHRETKVTRSLLQLLFFLAGIGVMVLLLLLE